MKWILFLLLVTGIYAQNIKCVPKPKETVIKNLKTEYSAIKKNISKYKMKTTDILDESSEGGTSEKYYDGNTLKLEIKELYGESGKYYEEKYFTPDGSSFIYTKTDRYNMPATMKEFDPGKTKTLEERYYLDNCGTLIRYIDGNSK